jgi:hypothetical protein
MKTLEDFVMACDDVIARYAECWERILRLPLEAFSATDLFKEARQMIHECRRETGDHTISWLKEQAEDGKRLVTEELAISPDDMEWQRIDAALSGALAGLADPPHC